MSFLKVARATTRTTATTSRFVFVRRNLATTVDSVTLPSTSTSESTIQSDALDSDAAAKPPSTPIVEQKKQKLPASTPPPTPYHPHVHVPLLSVFPSSSALSTRDSSSPLLVPLPTSLFNAPSRPSLLHKLIIAHLSSLRTGTAATKNRREVSFSGKKIRPQKGTGRARLGSRGSPMLKGGGRAFGKRPKGPDGWTRKVNRKEERLGLSIGLSDKWRKGQLNIVDHVGMEIVSTRKLKQVVGPRGWLETLFVLGTKVTDQGIDEQAKFELSAGNLSDITVVKEMHDLTVWDVVKSRNIVVELDAVDDLITRIDPEWAWEDDEFEEWTEEELAQAELEDIASEQELKASGEVRH